MPSTQGQSVTLGDELRLAERVGERFTRGTLRSEVRLSGSEGVHAGDAKDGSQKMRPGLVLIRGCLRPPLPRSAPPTYLDPSSVCPGALPRLE